MAFLFLEFQNRLMTNPDHRKSEKTKKRGASLFPMFLKLERRACLVVGAGTIAAGKIRSLLESGAEVRVVAPQANTEVQWWAQAGEIRWNAKPFAASDLEGMVLVIAATSQPDLNAFVFQEAQKRNLLCNAVDDPDNCSFYCPAVVRRGDLQIAISTAGHSPALAQRLRQELEAQFAPEYAKWIEELGRVRRQLFARDMDPEERRRLLHKLAAHGPSPVRKESSGAEPAREMPRAR